jgi:Fe-S cluster assembly ATP-binding protein
MARPVLEIRGLRVGIEGREIVKGLDLTVRGGEVHAIMGPNGTGKSTLASALMGHPTYEVLAGQVTLDGQNVLEMAVDERARAGLFLAMQYPAEIAGVSNANFLRTALNARREESDPVPVLKFHKDLKEKMESLSIDPSFAERYVNEGFSGGEKKRNEILQMAVLRPRIAILDEIDSGLDIDAVKIVAQGVNEMLSEDFGVLIITHYQRILNYIHPTNVHVMMQGRIVRSSGPELAEELEARGYDWLRQELGIEEPLSQEA